ncbi:MAG TPA: hypothetical protein VKV73_25790 [Chloroflexota bacterium]|nr:hypothetical protein [Chloroflexota bacterium]
MAQAQAAPTESTRTLGQLRAVMSWKVVEYGGLVAFTLLTPRLMGPVLYGRFAALLAITSLLLTACSLGGLVTFGRFLPQYLAQGDWPKARALFVQLFWARAALAALLAGVSVVVFASVLPGASWLTLATAAATILLGATASTCYQVFYGLNRMGRSTSQDALLRITLLALVLILGGAQSIERAVDALFFTQVAFLALGLFWTRGLFNGERDPFRFAFLLSHLHFGVLFFLAQLMLMAMWRSGEVLILWLTGRSEEVAFFSIANAVVMTVAMLLIQVAGILIPRLTTLQVAGDEGTGRWAAGLALKYLVIGPFLCIYAVYAIAPIAIEVFFGAGYAPVAANLKVLALGLPAAGVLGLALAVAVVRKQAGPVLIVNATGFGAFVALSCALVPPLGALGASISMASAMVVAAVVACWVFRLLPLLGTARVGLLGLAGLLGVGIVAVPMAPGLPLGVLASAVFLAVLFGTRLVTVDEVRKIVGGVVR